MSRNSARLRRFEQLAGIGTDDQPVSKDISLEEFVDNIRSYRNHIIKSDIHLPILIEGQPYYAVSAGFVRNLELLPPLEAFIKSQLNKHTREKISLNITTKQLARHILGAGEFQTAPIYFMGDDTICFLTSQQYDRLIFNWHRQENKKENPSSDDAKDLSAQETDLLSLDEVVADEVAADFAGMPEDGGNNMDPDVPIEEGETVSEQEPPEIDAEGGPLMEGDTLVPPPLPPREYPIKTAIDHFDFNPNAGEADFNDALTLCNNRTVGVLLKKETAGRLGFDASVLYSSDPAWALNFAKNHGGAKALQAIAGQVTYRGQAAYYASLGYMVAHKEQFESIVEPSVWADVQVNYRKAQRALIAEYWRQQNPMSIYEFQQRREAAVRIINGIEDGYFSSHVSAGIPVALIHEGTQKDKALKAIIVPGEIMADEVSSRKAFADPANFSEVWSAKTRGFNPDFLIVLSAGEHKVSVIGPGLTQDAVSAHLAALSPSQDSMLKLLYPEPQPEPVKPARSVITPPPARVSPAKPVEMPRPAMPLATPPVISAPQAKPLPAPLSAPPAPIIQEVPAAIPPSPAPAATLTIAPSAMKELLGRIKVVADLIKKQKAESLSFSEQSIGEHQLVIFGQALADDILLESAETYNAIREESYPVGVFRTVIYEGSPLKMADILKTAFDNAGKGEVTILQTNNRDMTVMISGNPHLVEFTKPFVS